MYCKHRAQHQQKDVEARCIGIPHNAFAVVRRIRHVIQMNTGIHMHANVNPIPRSAQNLRVAAEQITIGTVLPVPVIIHHQHVLHHKEGAEIIMFGTHPTVVVFILHQVVFLLQAVAVPIIIGVHPIVPVSFLHHNVPLQVRGVEITIIGIPQHAAVNIQDPPVMNLVGDAVTTITGMLILVHANPPQQHVFNRLQVAP